MNISFSIIMPTYNRKHCIKSAVDSLLAQSYQDFELIIIDDGSTDGTQQYLKNLYKKELADKKIRYFLLTSNKGAAFARNEGLKTAKGNWIGYLDTDNVMRKDFLETFARAIRENDENKVFYAQIKRIVSDETIGHAFDFSELVRSNFIDLGVFVHSVEVYKHLTGFDTNLTRLIDWDLIIRYTEKYSPVFIEKILIDYYDGNEFKRISNADDHDKNYKDVILSYLKRLLPGNFIKEYTRNYFLVLDKDKEIQAKDEEIKKKDKDIEDKNKIIELKLQEVKKKDKDIEDKNKIIELKLQDISAKEREINLLKRDLDQVKTQLNSSNVELSRIYACRGWRLVVSLRRVLEIILPSGSLRRRVLRLFWVSSRKARSIIYISSKSIQKKISSYLTLLRKAIFVFRRDGFKAAASRSFNYLSFRSGIINRNQIFVDGCDSYKKWIINIEKEQKKIDYSNIDKRVKKLKYQPKISILLPIYNTDEVFLRKAIFSVIEQYYQNWELCIVDDKSEKRIIKKILNEFEKRDSRIRVKFLNHNLGIAGATNEAAKLATGDFVAFLDHDDELEPEALYENIKLLNIDSSLDFIYSDDDKIDENGFRYDPQFKPDWSPELLLSYCYVSHFKVVRRKLFNELGGFKSGFDGSQDYEFLLRLAEKTDSVEHIAKILYHWRSLPGSVAHSTSEKPQSIERGRLAVQQALKRRGIKGLVFQPKFAQDAHLGIFKIKFKPSDYREKVTIVIPIKDNVELLKKCISSIEEKTSYLNYEIVVINNNSVEEKTFGYLKQKKIKTLDIKTDKFNFSKINNLAAQKVDSELLVFMNNDTEIISEDWLLELVGTLKLDKKIGAVGARLIYEDKRIQHAGIVLGLHESSAGHANKLLHYEDLGYLGYIRVMRNYSGVTAACMLTRRSLFIKIGGFDQENLAVAYNDIDYCLKLIDSGCRVVYNPDALLYHREGATRGYEDEKSELDYFKKKWKKYIERDPFYNINLSLHNEQFKIKEK